MDSPEPRILVVDDDAFMLRLMSTMLTQLGSTALTACQTGEAALDEIAEQDAFDLVFLDVNMPGMDGIEFIRRLATRQFRGGLVLVSGEKPRLLASIHRLINTHRLRSLGVLQKPVTLEALRARISQWRATAERTARVRALRAPYALERVLEAIARGEMTNHYQPQVAIGSGELVGVECLARWQHPEDGLVLPDQFIPVLEQHGMIPCLTRAVLANQLRQCRAWRGQGIELSATVNVSMDDIVALDFPDELERLVAQSGVEPGRLTLELTEGQVTRQLAIALDVLSRLQLKGFRLSIDDFGTGHSSLAQLRDLPFDELKIDRGFVQGAARDERLQAICSASVRMAKQLHMRVIAEGVELEDDWRYLQQLGCDAAQGYLFARPMPPAELNQWMQADNGRPIWRTE